MSIMVPPVVHVSTRSQGEREIFRRLHDDPATKDWIVLHSLDTANHIKNISGEVDFVIIIPAKGILCVEVKGCSSLKRYQGQWYYGSDMNPDSRGPFKQASEVMHTIRNQVIAARPDFSSIVFWSSVIFPYIDFTVRSEEWHEWQVIDSRALRSQPISQLILSILTQARTFLHEQKKAPWFYPQSEEPDHEQCKAIADMLRPSFEFFESPGSREERLQTELKHYTVEQCDALDAMQENPRVAFVGPAGTGKTLLAIEAARRGVASGRRVLFLCFNRLLGNWLQEQMADLRPNVVCSTLHSHMLNAIGYEQIDDNRKQGYWERTLPSLAVKKVVSSYSEEYLFDEVIIDEAQDILIDIYLDYVDVILRGGLASGRWRMFGDFEKQAIYTRSTSPHEILHRRCGNIPVFSVRCNCRNSPRLAELVHLLGGLKPPYTRILRPDDGVEPEIYYYSSRVEQKTLLIHSLEQMRSLGFGYEEIVVLSSKSENTCLASQVDIEPWGNMLHPYVRGNTRFIGYTTIHAFKGLEAPAIVITDVEHILGTTPTALFYVAITRALQRLTIIASSSIKQEMIQSLLNLQDGKSILPEVHS